MECTNTISVFSLLVLLFAGCRQEGQGLLVAYEGLWFYFQNENDKSQ